MSIKSEINRLTTLRINIRTKLYNLGIITNASATLADCSTAIEGITNRTSTDVTTSGRTVSVPKGYYNTAVSKSVSTGTQGTPTATKSVSGNTATVTPKCTDTTGYITGTTKTGTAVTVTASEVTSGNKAITANGTGIDVTNYKTVSVAVPEPRYEEAEATITENGFYEYEPMQGGDALSYVSITVDIPFVTVHVGDSDPPPRSLGEEGDIYIVI